MGRWEDNIDPLKLNPRRGPEAVIQDAIIRKLKALDWYVKSTHGNMYQSGFPDLYICHRMYGSKWVEVKNKEKYVFTPAQLENFPLMSAHGAGIWILTSDSDEEINKLYKLPNWVYYLEIYKHGKWHK